MRDAILAALKARGKVGVRSGAVEFQCPRHDDKNASGWMRDHAWGCFACGFSEPLASLADELGLPREVNGYTVEQYAREKKFSVNLLGEWGVETVTSGSRSCIAIPYLDEGGSVLRRKMRAGSKKWWEGKDLPIFLYGRNVLANHVERGAKSAVLFVEGESDCHALWHHGMLALGVPGANSWRPEWAKYAEGRDVYVWREPGAAGQQFVAALTKSFPMARIIIAPEGIKDPAELHLKSPSEKAFRQRMGELVRSALPVGTTPPPVIYDAVLGATLDALKESKKQPISAVPTPLKTWNGACRGKGGRIGLAHGWHVVVGAAPGFGKSLIASNMCTTAIQFGERPTYISIEMDQDEVITRSMACGAGIPIGELEHGPYFREESHDKAKEWLHEQYEKTGGYMLVNRDPIFQLQDILDSIRYNFEVNGSRLFLIDYLQLAWVASATKIDQQITEISHAVRQLAKELRVATVGFSQLNRETTKNRKEPPTPSGLMGGSPLENDAVQVLLLDHSCFERGERLDGSKYAKTFGLLCKNRHGPVEEIGLEVDFKTLRVRELMEDESLPQRRVWDE